jgi:hypothetical protein
MTKAFLVPSARPALRGQHRGERHNLLKLYGARI